MSLTSAATFLDALPDPVLVVDETAQLVDWNEALLAASGYTDEEVAGLELAALFPEEEVARVEASLAEAFEAGETELVAEVLGKDGDRVPYEFRARRTTGEHGRPVVVGVGRDVSDRKDAERVRAETETRFEQVTEHLDAGVWLSTFAPQNPEEAEILYISPQFDELGLDRARLEENPMNFLEFVHPDDVQAVRETIAAIDPGDPGFELDYRVPTDDGTVRHLNTRAVTIRDADGEPVRLAGITQDVTELRSVERQLVERKHQLDALLETAPAVVFALDAEGNFTLSEGQALEHLGLEPGEVVGDNVFDLFGDNEELVDLARRALDGEAVEGATHVADRWWQTRYNPRFDESGAVEGVVGVSLDVTEKVEAQRALAESQARYRSIRDDVLEASSVGLFILDEDMRVAWINEATTTFFGLDREEILGRDKRELIEEQIAATVEDPETFREILFATYASNEGPEQFVCHVLPGEDREERWLQHASRPIEHGYYEGGRLEHYSDITQQVRREQELAHQRHRYDQLLKAAPRCVVEVDREGVFVAANERAEQVFGVPPEEVVGRRYNDPAWRIRDLDGQPIPDEQLPFRQVRDAGEVVSDERIVVDGPDGDRILSMYGAPIFDTEGDVESAVFAVEDVTEEVEQQEAIERERDLRAALFEQNVDPVIAFSFDEQGAPVIRDVNASFCEVFGYERSEVLDRPVTEVLVPGEGRAEHEDIARRVAEGESIVTEVERMTADGPAEFRLQAIPLAVEGVDIDGYGWYTDLRELRALEQKDAFKARMLDEVGQAVIATDAEGEVTYWNSHAEETYGYTAEEAAGRQIMDLTVPDTEEGRRQAEEIMAELGDREPWTGEFKAKRKDGSTFPALVSDAPVFDAEGELVGVIGVSRDISDIKERERDLVRLTNQLRARNRELRELSQATAHEFHTPITDVARYLSLVAEEAGDRLTDEEREHLDTALSGAHRLHALVDSLQEFLDASTRRPTFQPTDARDVLDGVLDDLEEEIEATGAEIEVPDEGPDLAIDEELLTATLRHLLENALLFSGGEPPRVRVAFEPVEDDMWMISVADEGEGIDPRHHERIFRPFRSLHGIDEGAGPGLGLAMCRGIAEAHGGSIWVDSEEGEGATFYLTLPVPGAAPPTSDQEGRDEDRAGGLDDMASETDLWDES